MGPEALSFIVFIVSMLTLMGIGLSMALALVLTGAAMAWTLDFWDTQLLAQNLVAGVDSFPLLAVPFFILAGELMNSGGISRRIIDMAQAWVGHIRGGLGFVTIAAAILMASMSGSALADTAALATILLPMMRNQGYPVNTSAGLIAAGGIIAPIIPPLPQAPRTSGVGRGLKQTGRGAAGWHRASTQNNTGAEAPVLFLFALFSDRQD